MSKGDEKIEWNSTHRINNMDPIYCVIMCEFITDSFSRNSCAMYLGQYQGSTELSGNFIFFSGVTLAYNLQPVLAAA